MSQDSKKPARVDLWAWAQSVTAARAAGLPIPPIPEECFDVANTATDFGVWWVSRGSRLLSNPKALAKAAWDAGQDSISAFMHAVPMNKRRTRWSVLFEPDSWLLQNERGLTTDPAFRGWWGSIAEALAAQKRIKRAGTKTTIVPVEVEIMQDLGGAK